MAVVTNPTNLTLVGPAAWNGLVMNEQNHDAANGNKFDNQPGTVLFCRNTTVGALDVNFYADINGVEVLLGTVSIPGSGTQNGEKIIGPFKAELFNDHGVSVAAGTAQGTVIFKPPVATAGQIKFSPHAFNPSLR